MFNLEPIDWKRSKVPRTLVSIYTDNQLNPSLKGPMIIYSGSCTVGKGKILNNLRTVGSRTQADIENLGSDLSPPLGLSIQSLHLLECWQLTALSWIPLEALPSAEEFVWDHMPFLGPVHIQWLGTVGMSDWPPLSLFRITLKGYCTAQPLS